MKRLEKLMNKRMIELWQEAHDHANKQAWVDLTQNVSFIFEAKFAELIVKEMCELMEQAEDDVYHCFEPSERPTEYIEWLRSWQERFTKHFGVEK